ncbi:transposase [Enterococcus gilvus]|uniref:transposase n=1 Tax=Enterococcus gilvus TaxID=160453 RepID=UPI003ED8B859
MRPFFYTSPLTIPTFRRDILTLDTQLLTFASLDASAHRSGDFSETKNELSKRGSSYLHRTIWQAAFSTAFKDPAFSQYYQKLRTRGKSPGTAIGAVARKLVNTIFAI